MCSNYWSLVLFIYCFRSFHYLFELMENHSDVVYTLKASYLEVYNEKVQRTVEQTFQVVKKHVKL